MSIQLPPPHQHWSTSYTSLHQLPPLLLLYIAPASCLFLSIQKPVTLHANQGALVFLVCLFFPSQSCLLCQGAISCCFYLSWSEMLVKLSGSTPRRRDYITAILKQKEDSVLALIFCISVSLDDLYLYCFSCSCKLRAMEWSNATFTSQVMKRHSHQTTQDGYTIAIKTLCFHSIKSSKVYNYLHKIWV